MGVDIIIYIWRVDVYPLPWPSNLLGGPLNNHPVLGKQIYTLED